MNQLHHKEVIICPNCSSKQTATVEQNIPFWSYVHECSNCDYVITESEWEKVGISVSKLQ